jgi:hypothetical protein
MASFGSDFPESAWAQIQYKHQISDSCDEKMRTKMDEVNESRETKTVTLYHMLHGDKRAESRFLSYAPQIPCYFAAANKNPKSPLWYSLVVEQDLNQGFPKLSKKPDSDSNQDQEDNSEIQYMLEIRNGSSKKASSQDAEYLKLLHDLIIKVEVDKNSPLFQDPTEKVALQIASIKAIQTQEPTFCTFGVLPRWHGIPYQYAQIKEKWDVTDDEAENLEGHLHVAYDEILTRLNGQDAEMESGD